LIQLVGGVLFQKLVGFFIGKNAGSNMWREVLPLRGNTKEWKGLRFCTRSGRRNVGDVGARSALKKGLVGESSPPT